MSTDIRKAFRGQGHSCAMLGSPFMGRLMPLFADRLAPTGRVAERILAWPGDVGSGGQSVPLRVAGALHGLVLDGLAPGLAAVYPPHRVGDDALWAEIEAAFATHEGRIMVWLDQAPQTNEVRRAGALIPAMWWALARYPLPLHLLELGASGGLNLSMDRFALAVDGAVHGPADSPVRLHPDWRGTPPPAARTLNVAGRAGVDVHPLRPQDPADALHLTAYLWPDQPERLALTRGAIALSDTAPDRGDAGDWLSAQLDRDRPGTLTVVYHSVAWQYFPKATKAQARAALEAAGARATRDAPLAHIAMEADGDGTGAALTAELWPAAEGPGATTLARVDFHGRWVDWRV